MLQWMYYYIIAALIVFTIFATCLVIYIFNEMINPYDRYINLNQSEIKCCGCIPIMYNSLDETIQV